MQLKTELDLLQSPPLPENEEDAVIQASNEQDVEEPDTGSSDSATKISDMGSEVSIFNFLLKSSSKMIINMILG